LLADVVSNDGAKHGLASSCKRVCGFTSATRVAAYVGHHELPNMISIFGRSGSPELYCECSEVVWAEMNNMNLVIYHC
jgi:hypothetical protein